MSFSVDDAIRLAPPAIEAVLALFRAAGMGEAEARKQVAEMILNPPRQAVSDEVREQLKTIAGEE